MLFVAPLVYPSLSNDRSTVRHPKPSFISASATVRVPSFAACPDSRQEAQEIRPIFFVANVGITCDHLSQVHSMVRRSFLSSWYCMHKSTQKNLIKSSLFPTLNPKWLSLRRLLLMMCDFGRLSSGPITTLTKTGLKPRQNHARNPLLKSYHSAGKGSRIDA